jgi:hypothetical protein
VRKLKRFTETLLHAGKLPAQFASVLTRNDGLLPRLRLIALGAALLGEVLASQAATHTWTGGGTTGQWSDAPNWQGNSAPQPGESGVVLVFPVGTSRLSSTNDVTGLAVTQLVLTGTNYVLTGTNALILSPTGADSIAAAGSSNRVALPLVLQATNSLSVATNAALTLAGRLSGPGAFTLVGGGMLAVAPAAGVDNNYLGTAQVREGTLQLESGFRTDPIFGTRFYATAVPGPLVVGYTNSLTPATLTGMALSTNTALTLLGSGQYLVNGDLLSFASLAGDGFVDCQGQSFIVGGDNRSTTFSGRMNGSSDAGLQKVGTGTLTLNGRDVGPFDLHIEQGLIILDGNFTNSTATISGGGKLEGNGSLGTIFADGPFSPGHDGPGQLTAAIVDMDLDSILIVKLGGTNAGIDYDQLVATDTFAFTDPTAALKVQMLPGFVGAAGNRYTIVRLDSTNAIVMPSVPPGNTNGFNGLGEGSVFTLPSGAAFSISYKGGDMNDLVLTQVAARPILNPPVLLTNNSVLISAAASPGATYEVQANTNLLNSSGWLLLGTALGQGDGSLSFIHTNALSSPRLYYRLHTP